MIYKLKDLAEGKTRGVPMEVHDTEILGKSGCRKLHINDPKDYAKVVDNKERGRPSDESVGAKGGYRIVYREATVRGKPAMVIVSVGPRKGMADYKAVENRLAKQKTSAQRTGLQHSSGKPLKPQAPQESDAATSRRSSPRRPGPQSVKGSLRWACGEAVAGAVFVYTMPDGVLNRWHRSERPEPQPFIRNLMAG